MTREDAVKALENELNQWETDCKSYHAVKEALPLAIEALENENALIDRVLEIIDKVSHKASARGQFWTAEKAIKVLRRDILALKGERE